MPKRTPPEGQKSGPALPWFRYPHSVSRRQTGCRRPGEKQSSDDIIPFHTVTSSRLMYCNSVGQHAIPGGERGGESPEWQCRQPFIALSQSTKHFRRDGSERTRDDRAPRQQCFCRLRYGSSSPAAYRRALSSVNSFWSNRKHRHLYARSYLDGLGVCREFDDRQNRVADDVALSVGKKCTAKPAAATRVTISAAAEEESINQSPGRSATQPCPVHRRQRTSCRSSGYCRAPFPQWSSGRPQCCPWSAANPKGPWSCVR